LTPFVHADGTLQKGERHKSEGAMAAAIAATDLSCESTETASPRLSWMVAANEKGQKQISYQTLVASDEEKLKNGQVDIWDSGKVISDQSAQVGPQEGAMVLEVGSGGLRIYRDPAWLITRIAAISTTTPAML
jgi:hypothetical protein